MSITEFEPSVKNLLNLPNNLIVTLNKTNTIRHYLPIVRQSFCTVPMGTSLCTVDTIIRQAEGWCLTRCHSPFLYVSVMRIF